MLIFAVGAHLGWLFGRGELLSGLLTDTDSYTRLVRVRELWQGAAWTDPVTPSFSAPEGLSLHWTRVLDVLILAPAALLHGLAGLSQEAALTWAGGLISPLLHLLLVLAAYRAARLIWPLPGAWLAAVFVLSSPILFGYSAPGRADHHALIVLCGTLCLWAGLRALRGRRPPAAGWAAGAAGGLGVWVSPEALLFLTPVLAGFGIGWLAGPRPASAAAQGLRAALAAAAVLLLAILTERAQAARWIIAYDVVALPHLALLCGQALVFALVLPASRLSARARLALGGAVAAAVAAALLSAFPTLAPGLSDPALLGQQPGGPEPLAFADVQEGQPLSFGSWPDAMAALQVLGGTTLLGLPVLALQAWRMRRSARLAPLAMVGVMLLMTLFATVSALRFAADLALPAALAAAGFTVLLARRFPPRVQALLRPPVALIVILLPVLTVPAGAREPPSSPASCAAESIARLLVVLLPADADPRPILFSDDANAGPALAWFAPVRVVGAPYHRGAAALADTDRLVVASDEREAQALIARRQASLLLFCRDRPGLAEGFRAALLAGAPPPAWLAPIALPEDLAQRFQLWRVLPDRLGEASAAPP
ncbi:MAG: hypothetical protein RMK64_06965 [Rhodovarius sp.]|nr:hypothetical protein [Rhodovarius sp.]